MGLLIERTGHWSVEGVVSKHGFRPAARKPLKYSELAKDLTSPLPASLPFLQDVTKISTHRLIKKLVSGLSLPSAVFVNCELTCHQGTAATKIQTYVAG